MERVARTLRRSGGEDAAHLSANAVNLARVTLRWLLAIFFIAAGANHFHSPQIYLGMMPPWLPWPETLNEISGAAEILGGAGLIWPQPWTWPWSDAQARGRLRRGAGWGLLTLLVAIFPANLHVAIQGKMPGFGFSPAVLWWRLPFQALFMAAVWWVALAQRRED